uniref:Uncharacterized protein n=1 Tax=Panagrolaimus sp. ES5 TaxID=591445 RepID=A0AC34G577_9BILA
MKSDLEEEIKKVDMDLDLEKLLNKVKLFKAILQKADDVQKLVQTDETELISEGEIHCVESGNLSLEIPAIYDNEKVYPLTGDERAAGRECTVAKYEKAGMNFGSEKSGGKCENEFEKSTVKAARRKVHIETFLDLRERKLFSGAWGSKTVKKLADLYLDYRQMLNRLNPPSKTTVTHYAPLKKVTKVTEKRNFVVEQKAENYAKIYNEIHKNGPIEILLPKCCKEIFENKDSQNCENYFTGLTASTTRIRCLNVFFCDAVA